MKDSNKEIDDEILGQWLAGDLKGDALKNFESSESFATYQAIENYSNDLSKLAYNTESEFERLQQRINSKSSKFNWMKAMTIAASIAIVFSVGYNFFSQNSELVLASTIVGETKSVTLPDESEITLNIASSVEYSEDEWFKNREVKLVGEAYFKVSKGNKFSVKTSHGIIEVLGTEFNIRNRNSLTEVICYEGMVKVTDQKNKSTILKVGDVVRIENGTLQSNWTPKINENADWRNGFSSFQNVDLKSVIEELENQYGITVDCNADITNRSYVGAFPHDNLNEALELVFGPMQLDYSKEGEGTITIE